MIYIYIEDLIWPSNFILHYNSADIQKKEQIELNYRKSHNKNEIDLAE